MKLETRPLLLPTDTTYESLDEVPQKVRDPLEIYSAINGRENGIQTIDDVHDILDDFAGQQVFGTYQLDEGESVLQAVANYRSVPNRGFAWIEGIAVRRNARGLHIGSFALKHLIRLAEQTEGIEELGLRSVESAVTF
jgi:GNAT superfamily N-acetyltransferase